MTDRYRAQGKRTRSDTGTIADVSGANGAVGDNDVAERRTISPAQLRAARGALDWSRAELAQATGLSSETIKNIEHGNFLPQSATNEKIIETFSAHGVEFISIYSANIVGVVMVSDKTGGVP